LFAAARRKDAKYVDTYNALGLEFSFAAAMIEARTCRSEEQLAERMHSTQAVIACLESGRVKPSTR